MGKTGIYPGVFYEIIQKQKETQLLLAALRLDVFSYLDKPVSAKDLSESTGYDLRNLCYFLRSLVAINVLELQDDLFVNTSAGKLYLSKNSESYLGEYLLFWEKKTGLYNIDEFVRTGVDSNAQQQLPQEFYDFHELARLAAIEIRTGRGTSLVNSAREIFAENRQLKVLDLGGGSGRMLIELAKAFPKVYGVVFDSPKVIDIPLQEIAKEGLELRIEVVAGDFCQDALGDEYDLVIASGVLEFGGEQLPELIASVYKACKPGGYLYLVGHNISDNMTQPKEAILGWLSSQLAGLDILKPKSIIRHALETGGFKPLGQDKQQGVIQKLQGEWYQKTDSGDDA